MKTILLTAIAFLIAGAAGSYGYEAITLRHIRAQGFVLALTDLTFEIIYAAVLGVIGCLAGLIVGTAFYWFKRHSTLEPVGH